MSLETAQKVIVPQKKNYVPQFLKQRDINSYFAGILKVNDENTRIRIQDPDWFGEDKYFVCISGLTKRGSRFNVAALPTVRLCQKKFTRF
jgi:hypothetical protein